MDTATTATASAEVDNERWCIVPGEWVRLHGSREQRALHQRKVSNSTHSALKCKQRDVAEV
ncbi:hypothetical protein AMATHDRAFT_68681, partial [Amanita thiersii Skay4041]